MKLLLWLWLQKWSIAIGHCHDAIVMASPIVIMKMIMQ